MRRGRSVLKVLQPGVCKYLNRKERGIGITPGSSQSGCDGFQTTSFHMQGDAARWRRSPNPPRSSVGLKTDPPKVRRSLCVVWSSDGRRSRPLGAKEILRPKKVQNAQVLHDRPRGVGVPRLVGRLLFLPVFFTCPSYSALKTSRWSKSRPSTS